MQMQYRGNKNINTEKNQNHAPGIYRGIEHTGLKTKNITDKGYEKLYRGQIQWINNYFTSFSKIKIR